MTTAQFAIWGTVSAATAGVILRPFRIAEPVWALGGALVLVLSGLLTPRAALEGAGRGVDVYLFLTGMMLLAELARQEGLFDWLAAHAAAHARGSARRLFTLVYLVGILVTVFLSNDATAVVLTPAVAAVTRAARIERPLPYLLICAFIANAASFVLPISNPANLVIFGAHLPPLLDWLPRFLLPSALSIGATYAVLRATQSAELRRPIGTDVPAPRLTLGGRAAAGAILATGALLMAASALDRPLGLPTCLAALLTLAVVCSVARVSPWRFLRGVSWGVIPLVGGLFVLVEALDRSGAIRALGAVLAAAARSSAPGAAVAAGVGVGALSNLTNNLPAGLIAGMAVQNAHLPASFASAVLIGVDLGPNLSVTGSLATLLWLAALRREGLHVSALDFLKIGALVMPPALLLALASLLVAR